LLYPILIGNLGKIKTLAYMNKKLVTPLIVWLMFMVVGIAALANGVQHQAGWRIAAAAIALLISSGFIYIIISHTKKELKAVRVKK
jgi:hypothetical protein